MDDFDKGVLFAIEFIRNQVETCELSGLPDEAELLSVTGNLIKRERPGLAEIDSIITARATRRSLLLEKLRKGEL